MFKILLIPTLFVAIPAVPVEYGHGHHQVDYYTQPHYYYEYNVNDPHTGDVKSHKEQRKGDHTEGVYSLLEPGGSKRVVKYNVQGKTGGFVASVQRDPVKHVDKNGHVGVGYANSNSFQKEVQQVHFKKGVSYDGYYGGGSGLGGFQHDNEGSSSGGLFGHYSYGQGRQGEYGGSLGGSSGFQHQDLSSIGDGFVEQSFGEHYFQPSYSLGKSKYGGSGSSSVERRVHYSNRGNEAGLSQGPSGNVYAYGYGRQQVKPSYSVREDNVESPGPSDVKLQYSSQGNVGVSIGSVGGGSLNEALLYGRGGSSGGSRENTLSKTFSGGHTHGFRGDRLQPTYVASDGGQANGLFNLGGEVGSTPVTGNHFLSSQSGTLGNTFSEGHTHGFRGDRLQPTYVASGGGQANGLSNLGGEVGSTPVTGNHVLSSQSGTLGNTFSEGHTHGFRGDRLQLNYVASGVEHTNGHSNLGGEVGSAPLGGYHVLSSQSGNEGGNSASSLGGEHGFGGQEVYPSYLDGHNSFASGQGVSSGGYQLQSSHHEGGLSGGSLETGSLGGYQPLSYHGEGSSLGSGSFNGYHLLFHNGNEGGSSEGSFGHIYAHGYGGAHFQPSNLVNEGGQGGLSGSSFGENQLQHLHQRTEGGFSGSSRVNSPDLYQHGNNGGSSVGSLDGYNLLSSNYGHVDASSGNALADVHSHGFGGHRLQPAYVLRGGHVGSSGHGNFAGAYGQRVYGGEATSKVSYSTNGAKLYTSTKHLSPQKYHY